MLCLHTTCMPGAGRGQKKPWKPLALELQIVVNHLEGVEPFTGARAAYRWPHP